MWLNQSLISVVFQIVRLPGDQKTALTGESLYHTLVCMPKLKFKSWMDFKTAIVADLHAGRGVGMFLSCQKCPWLVSSHSAIWLMRSVGVTLSWILMTWGNMQLRHTNNPRYHHTVNVYQDSQRKSAISIRKTCNCTRITMFKFYEKAKKFDEISILALMLKVA